MAEILRCNVGSKKFELSILLIGPSYFCKKLKSDLHRQATVDKHKFEFRVHLCESVSEILKVKDLIPVPIDFIAFVLDSRIGTCLFDMEKNIKLLDTVYLTGRLLLVIGNELGIKYMAVPCGEIWSLQIKYGIPHLVGDINDPMKCLNLADKVLRYAIAAVGVKTGIPYISSFNLATKNENGIVRNLSFSDT